MEQEQEHAIPLRMIRSWRESTYRMAEAPGLLFDSEEAYRRVRDLLSRPRSDSQETDAIERR
jgi:hypothetical protein